MELTGGGGEVAARRPNLSSSVEDRLSALPTDILVLILLRLPITEAARTSVLSTHWRRIWTLLPELTFRLPHDYRHIREVLASSEAPLLHIRVITKEHSPESEAAWLPLAASRLTGDLGWHYIVEGQQQQEEDVALPCFRNATGIALSLGFLSLALPSSGTFTRLTDLRLHRVRFQGTCELGGVVSSPRCPCLRRLLIKCAQGVATLTVHSKSLLQMDLSHLNGLQQLNMDAPVLNELMLCQCFSGNQPVANISAPKLISLHWIDVYDPSYVQLGNLEQLQRLGANIILVYGHHFSGSNDNVLRFSGSNDNVLRFLKRFRVMHTLNIFLCYPREISNLQYLIEDMTYVPRTTFLTMSVFNGGHTFGAASFHFLRLCDGIRELLLVLHKEQFTCPSGCICDQPTNWKIEELSLNCLEKVDIAGLKGAEHEVAFLKQLFKWAVVLEKLKIIFDHSVNKSKAKEFCQIISSISRPETVMEFCVYRDSNRRSVELLLLEDESTGL